MQERERERERVDAPPLFTDAMKYWIGARDSSEASWNEEIACSPTLRRCSAAAWTLARQHEAIRDRSQRVPTLINPERWVFPARELYRRLGIGSRSPLGREDPRIAGCYWFIPLNFAWNAVFWFVLTFQKRSATYQVSEVLCTRVRSIRTLVGAFYEYIISLV